MPASIDLSKMSTEPLSPLVDQNNVGKNNSSFTQLVTIVSNSPETLSFPRENPLVNKNIPYFSAKRNTKLNLNCRAKSINSKPITCRHIAPYWARNFMLTHGKVDYHRLSTTHAICRSISPESEELSRNQPAEVHLAGNTEWGQVFSHCFKEMAESGQSHRTLLLDTGCHALAVGLKFKDNAEEKKCVIQFYDPNRTVAHKRVEYTGDVASQLASIETLAAKDFLDDVKRMEAYNLPDHGVSAFFDRHPDIPVMRIASLPAEQLNPKLLFHCLKRGLNDGLISVADRLNKQQQSMSPDTIAELLQAKRSNGTPGLLMALQNGHSGAVKIFGKMIQVANLPPDIIAELLAAKHSNGTPGLFVALQNGHSEAVKAFGKIIQVANLPSEIIAELLAAKNANGVTGLECALYSPYLDTVLAFDGVVRAAGLPADVVTRLLAPIDNHAKNY